MCIVSESPVLIPGTAQLPQSTDSGIPNTAAESIPWALLGISHNEKKRKKYFNLLYIFT